MNQHARLAAQALLPITLLIAGCASQGPSTATARPKSVPAVSIVIDCEKCQVPSKVPELVRAGYASAAAKAGIPIAGDTPFTVTITDYSDRSFALRTVSLVAGPMAFALKDEIKAIAVVDGRPLPLEYHQRSPFSSADAVAQKLGELSFDAIVKEACSQSACR